MNTKDRLVTATSASIRDVGLPATTAREITRRAEANLSAIPYHFGSKDALVAEALLADARDLVAPVLEALAGDGEPLARLTATVGTLNELFDRHRDQVPTYLAAVDGAAHSDEIREGIGTLLAEVRVVLTSIIDALKGEGQVPPWVDPPAMAALITSVVNGVILAAQADPEAPDHRAVAAQFLFLLANASATASGEIRPSRGGSDG